MFVFTRGGDLPESLSTRAVHGRQLGGGVRHVGEEGKIKEDGEGT